MRRREVLGAIVPAVVLAGCLGGDSDDGSSDSDSNSDDDSNPDAGDGDEPASETPTVSRADDPEDPQANLAVESTGPDLTLEVRKLEQVEHIRVTSTNDECSFDRTLEASLGESIRIGEDEFGDCTETTVEIVGVSDATEAEIAAVAWNRDEVDHGTIYGNAGSHHAASVGLSEYDDQITASVESVENADEIQLRAVDCEFERTLEATGGEELTFTGADLDGCGEQVEIQVVVIDGGSEQLLLTHTVDAT